MNFLKELRYLFEWLEDHDLGVGAIAMWLYLMLVNNCCALPAVSGDWLWRVNFGVANSRITNVLHCSERQMMRYREELVDKGRIRYLPGQGGSAGTYSMIPLRPNVMACELPFVLSDKKEWVYDYVGTPETELYGSL